MPGKPPKRAFFVSAIFIGSFGEFWPEKGIPAMFWRVLSESRRLLAPKGGFWGVQSILGADFSPERSIERQKSGFRDIEAGFFPVFVDLVVDQKC